MKNNIFMAEGKSVHRQKKNSLKEEIIVPVSNGLTLFYMILDFNDTEKESF